MKALILSGGGSKCAYQVGVLDKLINEENKDYDIVVGTNLNSFNAAILCEEKDIKKSFKKLKNIWLNKITKKYILFFNIALFKLFSFLLTIQACILGLFYTLINDHSSFSNIIFLLGLMQISIFLFYNFKNTKNIYSNKGLRKLIDENVDEDKIKEINRHLLINSTCFETGEKHLTSNLSKDLKKWILASTTIPIVFPMIEIDGRNWINGGLIDSAPLNDVIQMKATEIDIILSTRLDMDVNAFDEKNISQQITRFLDVMFNEIIKNDLIVKSNAKINIYMPVINLQTKYFDFSEENIKKIYEKGIDVNLLEIKEF